MVDALPPRLGDAERYHFEEEYFMQRTALAVLTILTFGACAYGSLYSWVDTNRPPVSMHEALTKAEELLGADRERYYCVSAHIWGNESGDGKEGAWNLMFAAQDGSRKHVFVDMQRKSEIRLWNGPVDWTANADRRTDLDDIQNRLLDVLKSHGLSPALIEDNPTSFTIGVATRQYNLHSMNPDGGYSKDTTTCDGPDVDGIWVRVVLVSSEPPKPPLLRQLVGPYWYSAHDTYLLASEGQFASTELRFGSGFPREIVKQLGDVCGERTTGPW